jgi:hypothetical protein
VVPRGIGRKLAESIKLYFSIVPRTVRTPNDLGSLRKLVEHITAFGEHSCAVGKAFAWTFTARIWSVDCAMAY